MTIKIMADHKITFWAVLSFDNGAEWIGEYSGSPSEAIEALLENKVRDKLAVMVSAQLSGEILVSFDRKHRENFQGKIGNTWYNLYIVSTTIYREA